MLFASLSKCLLCFFLCFKDINLASLQQSPQIEEQISAIAEDIRSYRFALAQEQILKIKDNNLIKEIIHDVYQNREESFYIILDFALFSSRVDVTFYVLKALRNEMLANGHNDPMKMIPVGQAFVEEVQYQDNSDDIIRSETKNIIKEIKADVKRTATDILTKSMLANDYFLNVRTENVAKEVFNFFYDLSDEVMREMVNRTYSFVPALQIVNTIMRSSKYIPQKVSVFLEVFKRLEEDNDLDNEAVMEIAACIRQVREEKNYANLFHNKRYDINMMIDRLPTCARNIFFSDEICIWSRGKMEYLYAADSWQNHSSARSVYTCPPDSLKTGEGSWAIVKAFEYFLFNSVAHKKEYLGASMRKYNWQGRYAQTKEKVFDDESNIWKIELTGEYCYIKSYKFNEYLFASNRMHSSRRRYVLSASARTSGIDPIDFQWQIRDCS